METEKDKFYLSAPIVIVENINGLNSNLNTLVNTKSSVSFISLSNFNEIFKGLTNSLELVDRKFNALPKTLINVLGKITTIVTFKELSDREFNITLYVVNSDFSDLDLIIGRDFLEQHNLTLIF